MWNNAVMFMLEVALDSVSDSHGTSARQAQLAESVHVLHLDVFRMACRLIKHFCRRPEGAHAGNR